MINIFINLLLVVHVLVCALIVLAVLMQRPKNEGLGAAFGGGMTDSLFGAQTTNVLANITRWLGVLFFVLTLVLSALYARQGREQTSVQQKLQQSVQPVVDPPVVPSLIPTTDQNPDAPKADAPKADAPKADAPKADAPKLKDDAAAVPLRAESEIKLSPAPPAPAPKAQ